MRAPVSPAAAPIAAAPRATSASDMRWILAQRRSVYDAANLRRKCLRTTAAGIGPSAGLIGSSPIVRPEAFDSDMPAGAGTASGFVDACAVLMHFAEAGTAHEVARALCVHVVPLARPKTASWRCLSRGPEPWHVSADLDRVVGGVVPAVVPELTGA
jgi:hypothetical protein